jgi:hypothetical protein
MSGNGPANTNNEKVVQIWNNVYSDENILIQSREQEVTIYSAEASMRYRYR